MSDNELDAELLGMVGGETDDEGSSDGEVQQTQAYIASPSPVRETKPGKASADKAKADAKQRTKGVAQKVRGRRKPRRKQDSEDEDDLGQG